MGCKGSKSAKTKASAGGDDQRNGAKSGGNMNESLTPLQLNHIKMMASETVRSSAIKNVLTRIHNQHVPAYTTGSALAQDSGATVLMTELKSLNYTKVQEFFSPPANGASFDPDGKIRIASDSSVSQEVIAIADSVIQSAATTQATNSNNPARHAASNGSVQREAEAPAGNAQEHTVYDDNGNPVVLPKGEWTKAEGTPYFYSEQENLYYHPDSCQFYDPTNEMWYDPEKDEWYRDDEDDEKAEN